MSLKAVCILALVVIDDWVTRINTKVCKLYNIFYWLARFTLDQVPSDHCFMHCALFYKQKEQLNMRNVNVHFKMCRDYYYWFIIVWWNWPPVLAGFFIFFRIKLAYLNSIEISIMFNVHEKCIKYLFGIMTTSTYKRYFVVCIIINASYLLLFTKKNEFISEGHI